MGEKQGRESTEPMLVCGDILQSSDVRREFEFVPSPKGSISLSGIQSIIKEPELRMHTVILICLY